MLTIELNRISRISAQGIKVQNLARLINEKSLKDAHTSMDAKKATGIVMNDMLPVMQTDIMLTQGEKTLIIDAKYYAHSTQVQYDKHTLHSGNVYQIFTYVKNKEAELADQPHTVSGMLLYAKTDEDIYPEHEYSMSGNRIAVRTLDLSGYFDFIRAQLDAIVDKYFTKAA